MPNRNHPSSWDLPPTDRQTTAITRICRRLGIKEALEEKPTTRGEARRLHYDLQLKEQGKNAKPR